MKEEGQKTKDKMPFSESSFRDLFQQIEDLQVSESNAQFPVGAFPSFRENKLLRYRRADDNIFVTASVVFILNQIKDRLAAHDRDIVEKITKKAQNTYSLYQNKDRLATYNFWKTTPSQHFPYGKILHKLRHFKLPDDIDDTALIYLTKPHSDVENLWLKEKLTQHSQRKIEQKSYVYSTWFGEKMPIEQDVCALCNLMYWVFESDLPLNEHDEATLVFLRNKILSGDFKKRPFQTARHYATVPLILYHYARLIDGFEVRKIADCKEIIVNEAIALLNGKCSTMEEILLSTVLIKLAPESEILQRIAFPEKPLKDDSFYSFIGAFAAPYSRNSQQKNSSFIQKIAAHPIMRFNWKCEAHELALQLESLVLRDEI